MIILLPFAVPYQGKRNQNEEGNRTTSASSRILSCANQVSSTHCSTRKVDRNVTLIFKHLPYIKCNIAHGKIARFSYFQDGLKTIEHFGSYVADLSVKLQKIRQTQDEERRRLTELRNLLRSSGCDKEVKTVTFSPRRALPPRVWDEHSRLCGFQLNVNANAGYSLHQLQGDKQHGVTRSGHLLKKSEGKMRRVWQKRRCAVQAEGYLDICHADENKPPTRVNLLTCQIKLVPDDKRGFDLISCKLDCHFVDERSFNFVTDRNMNN